MASTPLGRIASFYYLQYKTMSQRGSSMRAGMDIQALLMVGGGQGGGRSGGPGGEGGGL